MAASRLTGALALALICSCSEQLTKQYNAYHDALREGAIARGWIPHWIPRDATDIFEQHDIDTNETVIQLSAPAASILAIVRRCRMINDQQIAEQFSRAYNRIDRSLPTTTIYKCGDRYVSATGRTMSIYRPPS